MISLTEIDSKDEKRRIAINNGLDESARKEVSSHLSQVLADHYLLMLKTHNFHWNVKGPLFKSLHDLTEEQYEDLFEAIDELAERIRALGFDAPGSFEVYRELSEVEEGHSHLPAVEMIASLIQSHETTIATMRKTLKAAEAVADEVTVDMMVGRLTNHEKYAWMLRSFIEQ